MADGEEEGGYLQGLWEQRDAAAGQQCAALRPVSSQASPECGRVGSGRLSPGLVWQAHGGPSPHLHLHIGVGEVVLWRQLAVIIDEVVQDGGAEDGLQEMKGGGQYREVNSRSVGKPCQQPGRLLLPSAELAARGASY